MQNQETIYTHRNGENLKARIVGQVQNNSHPFIVAILFPNNEEYCFMYSLNEIKSELRELNYWKNMEVDTPILVCETLLHDTWKKRHFAKFENGMVRVWEGGMTSWTATGTIAFKYAKLPEDKE